MFLVIGLIDQNWVLMQLNLTKFNQMNNFTLNHDKFKML